MGMSRVPADSITTLCVSVPKSLSVSDTQLLEHMKSLAERETEEFVCFCHQCPGDHYEANPTVMCPAFSCANCLLDGVCPAEGATTYDLDSGKDPSFAWDSVVRKFSRFTRDHGYEQDGCSSMCRRCHVLDNNARVPELAAMGTFCKECGGFVVSQNLNTAARAEYEVKGDLHNQWVEWAGPQDTVPFHRLQDPSCCTGRGNDDALQLLCMLGGAASESLRSLQRLALTSVPLSLPVARALGQLFQGLSGSVTVLSTSFRTVEPKKGVLSCSFPFLCSCPPLLLLLKRHIFLGCIASNLFHDCSVY